MSESESDWHTIADLRSVELNRIMAESDALKDKLDTVRVALEFLADKRDGELCWCRTPICVNQPGCESARKALAALKGK